MLPVRAKTAIFNDYIYTRVLDLGMQSPPRDATLMKCQKESEPQYIAFQGDFGGKRGYYGCLRFTTFNRFFGGVSLRENGEFSACAHLDFAEIRPGDVIRTDNCCFYAQYGNKDVLSIYSKHIAKDNRAYPKAGTFRVVQLVLLRGKSSAEKYFGKYGNIKTGKLARKIYLY